MLKIEFKDGKIELNNIVDYIKKSYIIESDKINELIKIIKSLGSPVRPEDIRCSVGAVYYEKNINGLINSVHVSKGYVDINIDKILNKFYVDMVVFNDSKYIDLETLTNDIADLDILNINNGSINRYVDHSKVINELNKYTIGG